MKLLKSRACLWALDGGNVKTKNMMVETTLYGLSDRGSIPLTSMNKILEILNEMSVARILCFEDNYRKC